jgi:hypothetical protein
LRRIAADDAVFHKYKSVMRAAVKIHNQFGKWDPSIESRDGISSLWKDEKKKKRLCILIATTPPVSMVRWKVRRHPLFHTRVDEQGKRTKEDVPVRGIEPRPPR